MNIDRTGALGGQFDVTLDQTTHVPDVDYWGEATIGADCTGTLSITTEAGNSRTDSIALVEGGREIWGMSQDPTNLWTYRVTRLSGPSRGDDD
jgi:hypothetical protein